VRVAGADSASSVRRFVTRVLNSQGSQQADVAKSTVRTWSAASAGIAYVTSAGVHRVVLSATSTQVATVGRAVAAIRLSVSINVALRRRDVTRVVRASQGDAATLVLVPIRPNFLQPLGELIVEGGDVATASTGGSLLLSSTGINVLLTTTGSSGTLVTTER
jgi:hypothetical protein